MHMDTVILGEFISKRRTELHMTQAELAEKIHVTNKAVSKWENGRGLPDIDNMQELAVALELNLQELLECHVYQKEEEKGGTEKVLQEALAYAQMRIGKARRKCLFILILAWGLMFALIYVMCTYMNLNQHLELRALLIGFLVLEVGLIGNVLRVLQE